MKKQNVFSKILFGTLLASSLIIACKKDTEENSTQSDDNKTPTQVTPKPNPSNNQTNSQGGGGGQAGFRVVSPNTGMCYNYPVNCCPEDVIINGAALSALDAAIANNTIHTLFSEEEMALELLPDWNQVYMNEYKNKILSGDYTFRKESYDNAVYMYFLCTLDEVETSNFDLAIPYHVE